jgi:hypothetical protein
VELCRPQSYLFSTICALETTEWWDAILNI